MDSIKIIFYNNYHIGDHLFIKSFIKQFCELNKTFDISLLISYNTFLFSDISNLNIIIPSNDTDYTNSNFNGWFDPIFATNINNDKYLFYKKIIETMISPEIKYFLYNNEIIFINMWIGANKDKSFINLLECNLINCNNYYNNIIKGINNNYNTKINLINYIDILPNIPNTNIDNFLNLKLSNKKIIFYYNYYPNSNQNFKNINHEYNIKALSLKYKDYIICCAIKPEYTANNIVYMEYLGYKKDITCENVAKALYCAINSNYVFSFDVGACFYYLNDIFNNSFNGIWYHISYTDIFYKPVNNILNNNNVIYKNLYIESDITNYITS